MTEPHRLSCPLCSSPIAGRNAAEVWEEHEDMVKKAKAAVGLAWAAEHFAQSWAWSQPGQNEMKRHLELGGESPYQHHFERLREELEELRAAIREWGEATRS